MHLHTLMGWDGPLTRRQFVAWAAFRAEQWNEPSRADHYAMQTAAAVVRSVSKQGSQVRVSDYRLSFGSHAPASPPPEADRHAPDPRGLQPATAVSEAKAAVLARMTLPVTVVKAPAPPPDA